MAETRDRHSSAAAVIVPWFISGLALVGVALIGYLLLDRTQRMESLIEAQTTRLNEVAATAEEARNAAETARRKALDAEDFARISAEGRLRAEIHREASERRADRLEEVAEQARVSVSQAQEELARLRSERDAEMNRLQRALNRIAETRRTSEGVVMNLGSDTIKFDFDRANLKPEYRELLSRIAGILLTSSGYRVQIYGHTDDIGTEAYNQQLSERRAQTVRDYLVDAGIDAQIITTKGFGKTNPLFPGDSPEIRAKNRRVEIGIIDTVISYQGLAEAQ
jgi:outer membrane protein OmpA-like peptidoglycan-associated protein